MLYDIRNSMRYAYGDLANLGHQLLRVVPADVPGEQRLVSVVVESDPPANEHMTRTDFFGTRVDTLVFHTPHREAEFRVYARVERVDPGPTLDVSVRTDRISITVAAARSLGQQSPHHFTGPSPRSPEVAAMSAYARQQIAPGMTVMQAVQALGRAIHRDMRYDPDATEVDTPVEEAFLGRHGVCQDYSHMMISMLRSFGIPAGYVSGYLRTYPPEGKERLVGVDAMHAWIRAWCGPDMGWYEFDPTNAIPAGADHIVIGYGRDYSDLPPVKGILRTARRHAGHQSVDVLPLGA